MNLNNTIHGTSYEKGAQPTFWLHSGFWQASNKSTFSVHHQWALGPQEGSDTSHLAKSLWSEEPLLGTSSQYFVMSHPQAQRSESLEFGGCFVGFFSLQWSYGIKPNWLTCENKLFSPKTNLVVWSTYACVPRQPPLLPSTHLHKCTQAHIYMSRLTASKNQLLICMHMCYWDLWRLGIDLTTGSTMFPKIWIKASS